MPIFRDLKVKLTDAEWSAIASQWGSEQSKRLACESEKAAAMSGFKARIELHLDREHELGEKVRTHEEIRAVECWERKDPKRFVVELFRADTGEQIETRPMTAAERHEAVQSALPGVSLEPVELETIAPMDEREP